MFGDRLKVVTCQAGIKCLHHMMEREILAAWDILKAVAEKLFNACTMATMKPITILCFPSHGGSGIPIKNQMNLLSNFKINI